MKEQYEALKMEVIAFEAEIGTSPYNVTAVSGPLDPTNGQTLRPQ